MMSHTDLVRCKEHHQPDLFASLQLFGIPLASLRSVRSQKSKGLFFFFQTLQLQAYSSLDERVRDLVITVKLWAKARFQTSGRSFQTFCWAP